MAAAEAPLWGYWRRQLRAELHGADSVHGAGSRDGACKNPRGARSWPEGRGQGSEGAEKGLDCGWVLPKPEAGPWEVARVLLSLQIPFSLYPFSLA